MSAEEGNGLSLEGLAQRLQTQAQKLQTLEQENAELRSEVAELKDSDTARAVEEPAASSSQRRVSRSWLLRNAGAAAVGTMAAGALLARDASVAKADHFAPGISVDYVITHLETAGLTAVLGNAPNGEGVVGFGKTHGVRGEGQTGVFGKTSVTGFGGVSGQHTGSGYGVVGDGRGADFAGVLGRNSHLNGTGVLGAGGFRGVEGRAHEPNSVGVFGGIFGSAEGHGVIGAGRGLNSAGVRGVNSSGPGVVGGGTTRGVAGISEAGSGVFGQSLEGYAGAFEGGKAQLRIVPKSGTGRPTSGAHTKGEIYLDSAGTLFVCTANGTPGTWRKITTTAA